MNLDLFSVGIVTAAIGILGFSVFLNKRNSITNESFQIFSLITIAYIVLNYLAYVVSDANQSLLLFRLTIFVAVWHAFYIFQLLYVFPAESFRFPMWYKWILAPLTACVSILNLTPFVLSKVGEVSSTGKLATIVNGRGIIFFGMLVLVLIIGGVVTLLKKTIRASGIEKIQFRYVLLGTLFTFILIITFNFVLPALFNNSRFISLGPVFFLPFVIFTTYAIVKHHLLNIKVIAAEILVFALAVATLFEIIISQDILTLILRSSVFILVLSFGILLIQSVLREVEQREELEALTQELQNAKDKLEELNRFKTQLLSLASHQVKSPLAAIKGFATLLSQGLYGPVEGKVKETILKINRSADGLLGLINTLLDLRKVEEGKMEYQFTKTDLTAMLRDVVEELESLADQKKLAFSFDGPKIQVFVSADPQKLKQVFQNLVDNAIKYTPNGFVKVMLGVREQTATVSIADSGLGIPPDLAPHLFEEFIRDERVKQKILGTGLGLFIARKIIEAHGGNVSVQSEGEGKGSTFTVTLKTIA